MSSPLREVVWVVLTLLPIAFVYWLTMWDTGKGFAPEYHAESMRIGRIAFIYCLIFIVGASAALYFGLVHGHE